MIELHTTWPQGITLIVMSITSSIVAISLKVYIYIYIYILSKNVLVNYNLIDYATRYLFVNRYRVAASNARRSSFSQKFLICSNQHYCQRCLLVIYHCYSEKNRWDQIHGRKLTFCRDISSFLQNNCPTS